MLDNREDSVLGVEQNCEKEKKNKTVQKEKEIIEQVIERNL